MLSEIEIFICQVEHLVQDNLYGGYHVQQRSEDVSQATETRHELVSHFLQVPVVHRGTWVPKADSISTPFESSRGTGAIKSVYSNLSHLDVFSPLDDSNSGSALSRLFRKRARLAKIPYIYPAHSGDQSDKTTPCNMATYLSPSRCSSWSLTPDLKCKVVDSIIQIQLLH